MCTWIITKHRIETLLRVFDRLGTKRWLYMSVLCSVSERIHSYLPEEAQVLFHAFKNMNKSNQLESSTSHFSKLSWHDWTDLLVKLWRNKSAPLERGGMGRNNRFISITVFLLSLEAEIKIETEFRLIE